MAALATLAWAGETGMARRRAGRVRKGMARTVIIDATPERLAKGDDHEFINPALIDSSQPIGRVRRFRAAHLDRLHRAERLSWRQWYAGDWYRDQHARCSFALSVVASYGERTSAGEPAYGLPRSEAQARARRTFRAARDQWPTGMAGFMDRLLIHDSLPRYGGNQYHRSLRDIAAALDALADWLVLGHEADE